MLLHRVYRALRKVGVGWKRIQEKVREESKKGLLFKSSARLLLTDFTTLYFESSEEDTLRRRGYSKDGKADKPQLLGGVMLNGAGIPEGVVLLPGDMSERRGVLELIDTLSEGYSLDDVIWVGDRGMYSKELRERLSERGIKMIEKVPRNVLSKEEKAEIIEE